MPPYAADLETWWLGSGYHLIKELMNTATSGLDPWQCGFAPQMKSRLVAFDQDTATIAQIKKDWPAIRAARCIDYDANSRKYAKYVASTIFRKPENGGINFDLAMNGLGYLDAIEIRRLRLIEAADVAIQDASETWPPMLHELERTSSANFKKLHGGLRVCILTEELAKDASHRKEAAQIMALLNALMPSSVFMGPEDDVDPAPHSSGVRDSVRFAVFEYLISEDCFTQERQEVIKMKLRCWSDISDYTGVRDAMARYCEEFKKVEELSLRLMNKLEKRAGTVSYHAVSANSPMVPTTDTSCNSGPQDNFTQVESTVLMPNASLDNKGSSKKPPTIPQPPLSFHPLLRGMPGRELSAAKTDIALLARDTSQPPVACYPNDLSKTLFYQHPLARELEMTTLEQYDLDSEDEADEDVSLASPHAPNPDKLKVHPAPGVLDKIKKEGHYQPAPAESTRLEDTHLQPLDECISNSNKNQPSHVMHPPMFTGNVPQFEPFAGTDHQKLSFDDTSHEASSVSQVVEQSPGQSTAQDTEESHSQQEEPERENPPPLVCKLAKPRISPMEYARMYLLEKSAASRENRECELPRPDMQWHWTPGYKKFFIIPRIPETIQRDLVPADANSVPNTDVDESNRGHKAPEPTEEKDPFGHMRLSLHLGEAALFPVFPGSTDFKGSDEGTPYQGSSKATEASNSIDAREGKYPIMQHRGPAGGRVEDWRPMSEYETDVDDEESDTTTPIGVGDDKSTNLKPKKATQGDTHSPTAQTLEVQDRPRVHIATEELGECSSGSHKSFETAARNEFPDQADVKAEDDAGNLTLSGQLSRVCTKDMSVLDFATPRTKGTLTKRVVDSSGGQLLSENIRQAQLISSPREKPPQGLNADLWDIDAESMLSELKPEPLQINRQRPRANTGDDRRWSRMFNGLNADVPSSLGMIRLNTSPAVDHEFAVANVDDDDGYTATESDLTPRASGTDIRNAANVTPTPRGLQRSTSTIITPTQPNRRLHHQASYNLDNVEHSGFTPEHRRESITYGTFPRSGVMLNLRDTQARLRYPLHSPEESQLSRSLDDTTPKAKHFNGASETDRNKQSSIKEWVKSIAITPRKPKIASHARIGDHRDSSASGDQVASYGTLDQQNVQPFLTTSTRDFSQSQKLQKQRSKPKHTPSSTHPFPKQDVDTQGRAQSPVSPTREQALAHRRTPSPSEQGSIAVPLTPSGIGSVLRRRVRSGYSTPGTPRTPRTPASPQLAWRPFDDDQPEPPCVLPWLSNNREVKREKEKRVAFFREKAELELEDKQSPKRPSRRSSFGSTILGDHTNRDNPAVVNLMSNESLVTWTNFIQDAPEPLFSSPPPPVPPLPTESQLNIALGRLRQAQTPSRAAVGVETLLVTSYRARKPQGLKVDTDWARQAGQDGSRTPSRHRGTKPASGSSNRTTLRFDGRQMGLGQAEAEEERQGSGQDGEIISRRK
ncbi:unnamed protein product [Fusarium graminearum]|uniref:Chromosome 3, complete genome n=1 Tax=Gibberella zeae (strain ATCC MYA-4620 / CBS 123657 / FGSC 9075 / NRRL 31084 / PH-1) TaxID=229533 RepID=A0A0E0SKH0_GIBZE|nr:hypothetical protein FG05_13913 [Fusarium graminearum]CEF86933.1 unnamed protein product [Fusarium graminearum]